MNCAQLSDVAPELALGVLTGRERADALEHLDTCGACRQLVSSLSGVTDELLRGFAPSVEPPAGFERRVLQVIAPGQVVAHRRRGLPLAGRLALAAAACLVLVVGLLTIGRTAPPAFAAAEMRTDGGAVVGWIYVEHDNPADVYMDLPGWGDQLKQYGQAGNSYSLRVTDRAGNQKLLPVSIGDDAKWQTTLDLGAGNIASAALVDDSGHVWCQARLDAA